MPANTRITLNDKAVIMRFIEASNDPSYNMTETEKELHRRICICAVCSNVWLKKRTGHPRRCPVCQSQHWDLPLLTAEIARRLNPPTMVTTEPTLPLLTEAKDGDPQESQANPRDGQQNRTQQDP